MYRFWMYRIPWFQWINQTNFSHKLGEKVFLWILTDFACGDRIYIYRGNDKPHRWKLTWKSHDKAETDWNSSCRPGTRLCAHDRSSAWRHVSSVSTRVTWAIRVARSVAFKVAVRHDVSRRKGATVTQRRSQCMHAQRRIKSRKTRATRVVRGDHGALIRLVQPLCHRQSDRDWGRRAPWPAAVNRA